MQSENDEASVQFDLNANTLVLQGHWTRSTIDRFVAGFDAQQWPGGAHLTIDAHGVKSMDSAGAWLFEKCKLALKKANNEFEVVGLEAKYQTLVDLVDANSDKVTQTLKTRRIPNFLYRVGEESHRKLKVCDDYIVLIGALAASFGNALLNFKRFHFTTIFNVVDKTGYRALPIIALLSFLIGIVLAYQMGLQLQEYGANIYIVFLTGIAILREFAPLITAIIVAGRTGSAYTAEIGTMKVNEEIDALKTMGLSPVERLVLPKVIGLSIALPLLVFWSSIFGIFGSMVMSKFMLNIGYLDFLQRLQESVGLSQLLIGLSKAPIFALIIASVGCYQGFLVSFSADSVGIQTTKSVVQALFLIIIADAAFSVFYSWLDL